MYCINDSIFKKIARKTGFNHTVYQPILNFLDSKDSENIQF